MEFKTDPETHKEITALSDLLISCDPAEQRLVRGIMDAVHQQHYEIQIKERKKQNPNYERKCLSNLLTEIKKINPA